MAKKKTTATKQKLSRVQFLEREKEIDKVLQKASDDGRIDLSQREVLKTIGMRSPSDLRALLGSTPKRVQMSRAAFDVHKDFKEDVNELAYHLARKLELLFELHHPHAAAYRRISHDREYAFNAGHTVLVRVRPNAQAHVDKCEQDREAALSARPLRKPSPKKRKAAK